MVNEINLEMSSLEHGLKYCFQMRPDVHQHILTSDELTDYIRWLLKTYGRENVAGRTDAGMNKAEDDFVHGEGSIRNMGTRLLKDPQDEQALKSVSGDFEYATENSFFMENHNISVAREFRYMPGHWHSNDYFELYYALSGDCPVHFKNEIVPVSPGMVLIVAPGIVHATTCYDEHQVLLYYMIRRSSFERVFWNLLPTENLLARFFQKALSGDSPNSYLIFETGNDPEIRRLLTEIYIEVQTAELYYAEMMDAMMSQFFILLLRRYQGTARLPKTEDIGWKQAYSAILNYIQTHYATVRQSELAEHFHYSERQIARIVRDTTGLNFVQLITRLKMEHAASMLKGSSLSADAISEAVGYANTSSFDRAFQTYYHCTPTAYRNIEQVD